MNKLEKLKNELARGSLSRRDFLQRSAALGAGIAVPGLGLSGLANAAPKKGGTLRFGIGHGATTDGLNPGAFTHGMDTALSFSVHGHVTEIDAAGNLQGGIAESWSASEDASEWTFKLRPDITFHSGKTLTPDDVIASINHHRKEGTTSAAAPLVTEVADITADGANAVLFKLKAGNADFPYTLSDYHFPIGPSADGEVDWGSGDGVGSYKIEKYEPGVKLSLSRNPNHWDGENRGHFDAIEVSIIIDPNARTSAMVAGNVDAIDKVDLKTAALLGRKPDININSVSGTQHYTFVMASNKDPYTDMNVRQALKYAVNREELVEKILHGYGSVGNDHPIGSGQRFYNKDLAQTPYDPDKAKWHLKEAGLDSLKIDLSSSDAAFGGAVDAAILYQNSASAAGIEIKVVREPNDGYWSDVWMKKPFSAAYWSGRPVEDAMFATAYQTGASWNDSFWSSARFDELLLAARAELNEEKRREMYYEMQAIVNQEGGVVIPMFASYVFATTSKIGHGDLASNWDVDGQRWAERWWFA
jgi:peptide/nickel transport system substrate-binding protein